MASASTPLTLQRSLRRALRAPLDVLVVRKLGVPFNPEPAMGAIGEGMHVSWTKGSSAV